MPKHAAQWIILADASRARILTRRGTGFDVVSAFEAAEAHARSHDLRSERPGRAQESANSAHHAIEPRVDPHEASTIEFLETVAAYLNENATGDDVRGLLLFAPPRALGHLRKMLSEPVVKKIELESPKDLTRLSSADLATHLDTLAEKP
ncbi:MAG TPA: host attachment protein [Stellaceae bacterium]|nr:host attachment protein [Stellaceae bacterium]